MEYLYKLTPPKADLPPPADGQINQLFDDFNGKTTSIYGQETTPPNIFIEIL